MDFERLRNEMVDLLHSQGIDCPATLSAMRKVPRHRFLEAPPIYAYCNEPWAIGNNQTISQPYIVARMTGLAVSGKCGRVLELGTGSGYQAAVLAELFEQVYSIERIAPLYTRAGQVLGQLGYRNIYLHYGDGMLGWPQPEFHPFDVIICTAAAANPPAVLFSQLADPGLLILPLGGQASHQTLACYTKRDGVVTHKLLEPVRFVPMLPGML